MEENMILFAACGAVMLVGGLEAVYQIYRIVLIDAKARGLKHPKFWGLFAISGNNSGGLIMYLIGRRKYPILNMTMSEKREIEKRKKAAGAGLVFLAAGTIGLVLGVML
ncbi:MAG: hypothetical protein K1W34_16035 [Lachnospiraceae bacterium]